MVFFQLVSLWRVPPSLQTEAKNGAPLLDGDDYGVYYDDFPNFFIPKLLNLKLFLTIPELLGLFSAPLSVVDMLWESTFF